MPTTVPSYYDILKVARDAPAGDIRSAYRKLAQRYHPDKSPDNVYAPRVMAHLNRAYEILSDPARRAKHDLWIARKESSRPLSVGSLSRPAPLPDLERRPARWPWYLLFATLSCAVAAWGTVAWVSAAPVRSAGPAAQKAPQQAPARTPRS